MGTSQYHQDIQDTGVGVMDTASNLQNTDGMTSSFMQDLSSTSQLVPPAQSQLIQEAPTVFSSMADTSGISMSMLTDIPSDAVFMTPMDVSVPHSHPGPSGFLPDMATCDTLTMIPPIDNTMGLEMLPNGHSLSTSPRSQISPPSSTHGTGSSYTMGVTSSLESALDRPGVPTRSRANTLVSSVIGSPFLPVSPTTPNMPFLPLETVISKQEDVSCKAEVESLVAVDNMLEDIEQTAKHARAMLQHRHDAVTSSSIGHLNERISQVTQKFAGLVSISSALAPTAYALPLQSPGIPAQEQKESPLTFPPTTLSPTSMDVSELLTVSDQSRKRCASELEEHRNVKAPKREPQDDVPLNVPFSETLSKTEMTPSFSTTSITRAAVPIHTISAQPQSPSRAPTPPSFHGPFTSNKSGSTGPNYTSFTTTGPQLGDFNPSSPTPLNPTPLHFHSSWSDPVVPTRHSHSLSTSSLSGPHLPQPTAAVNNLTETFSTPPMQQVPLQAASSGPPNVGSPSIGRMSRSGSINGTFPNSYGFGYIEPFGETVGPWPNGLGRTPGVASTSHCTSPWFSGSDCSIPTMIPSPGALGTAPSTVHNSPFDDDDDDPDADSDDNENGATKGVHHSSDSPPGTTGGSDIPLEYRAEVDRIFFEYLNKICSNLDATDSKGEPIHQTLMAKKMQRLDESPDFRPFKFRIQAFTLAFLEELANNGYPEEKIPMKKVRNYLWRQQYILRFNEDGKKAKSKGNHIWNIEAKKIGEGKWEFRPFHRKLAGTPPSVAYCGHKWSWSPRVWDPQASWQNIPVEYSSPSLPSWLSWKDDVLSGVPPPDAGSCHIVVNAKFVLDGQEGNLSHSFYLTIAPMNAIDTSSFTRPRRPSVAGDPPRRSASDSVLSQTIQRTKPRLLPAVRPSPESPDTRVIRVLQSVAQRVTEEAESQIVSASPSKPSDFQDLVKQKHVLEQTVDAYDKAISGGNPAESRRLAVAAQNVVVQAAHTVIADRTVANGGIPVQQSETAAIKSVTVTELSDATQNAIAQAVKREGTGSTEVDIMVAATSILKLRTAGGSSATVDPMQTTSQQLHPRMVSNKNLTYPLSSVSEYV